MTQTCPVGVLQETLTAGVCSGSVTAEYALATTNPSGSCEPSKPGVTGELKGDGAVTFCCM